MLAYHWRLYRLLFFLVVVLLAVSTWVTVAWWQGVVDRLAALEKSRLAVVAPLSVRAVSIYSDRLPRPYTLVGSIRGDIAPSPGPEVLAVGQDQNDRRFAAFVLDANHTVQFVSPLLAQPTALEVHARSTAVVVFRVVLPETLGTSGPEHATASLDIRWDGTRYVVEEAGS